MNKWLAVICVVALSMIPGFAAQQAQQQRHPEYDTVRKTIEGSIGWAIKKDFEYLFSIFADDPNFFQLWLTSDSKVVGIEAFKTFSERWRTPDFRGTRFEFKELRINFSRSGSVAWYSAYVDDCGEFRGKEYCINDVFQTGVLEKRDGHWVHVQIHGSYPVDKIPEAYVRRYYQNLFEKSGKQQGEKNGDTHSPRTPFFAHRPPFLDIFDTLKMFLKKKI